MKFNTKYLLQNKNHGYQFPLLSASYIRAQIENPTEATNKTIRDHNPYVRLFPQPQNRQTEVWR